MYRHDFFIESASLAQCMKLNTRDWLCKDLISVFHLIQSYFISLLKFNGAINADMSSKLISVLYIQYIPIGVILTWRCANQISR